MPCSVSRSPISLGCDLGSAFAQVGVGPVGSRGADGEPQPQRAFSPKRMLKGLEGLGVETTIAMHLGVVLHQIARTPGTKCFLIANGGQGKLTLESRLHTMQIDERKNRASGATLHVGRPAAPDFSVCHRAAPGCVVPGFVLTHRKNVDMTVQDQVLSRCRRLEARHDIRELGLWIDDSIVKWLRIQGGADMSHRLASVTRRVGALGLNEPRQKVDQQLSISRYPAKKLLLVLVHWRYL